MNRACYEVDTPRGKLFIKSEGGVPVEIRFPGSTGTAVPLPEDPPPPVREAADAIAAYFAGKDPDEALIRRLLRGLDLTPFTRAVLMAVTGIPRGETLSYSEVASLAGRPGAARAVGNIMAANPFPILIPCHRVIRGDGSMGGFGGGLDLKAWLLEFERRPVPRGLDTG